MLARIARCRALHAVRGTSARRQRRNSTGQALAVVLKEEWDGEQANLAVGGRLEQLVGQLQARGGAISDEAGDGRVTITLPGVVATFDCRDVPEEDDAPAAPSSGDADAPPPVEFDASVAGAGGAKLVFECVAADSVQIDAVAFYGAESGDDAYDGPKFDELDAKLQASFYAYLEGKGVDPDLCETICAYASHKEALEYANWLERCGKFLEASEPDDA